MLLMSCGNRPTEPIQKSNDIIFQSTLTMMKINFSTIIRCPSNTLYGGIERYFIKCFVVQIQVAIVQSGHFGHDFCSQQVSMNDLLNTDIQPMYTLHQEVEQHGEPYFRWIYSISAVLIIVLIYVSSLLVFSILTWHPLFGWPHTKPPY